MLVMACLLGGGVVVRAHEGHDHGALPGAGAGERTGPLILSDSSIANLGIKTAEADLVEMAPSLEMLAQITPLPENLSQVTPGFEGTVVKLLAKLGERVEANQPLLILAPRMVGNPNVTVRAAISGVVTAVNVTLGQGFAADAPLMTVADYSRILARGTAYESRAILDVKIGAAAKVQVDVSPEETYTGVIQRADAGLGADAKTFEVYAVLENSGLKLRPNLLGRLSVALGKPESVLAVPQKSVLGEMGERFLYVREGSQFERRTVVLGRRSGGMQEIIEGVVPGEQVVVQGNYQLQYATSSAPTEKKELPAMPMIDASSAVNPMPGWIWALSGGAVGLLLGWIIRPTSPVGEMKKD